MSPFAHSEFLLAAIAVGGALVTFVIGVCTGLVVTSRYKQIAGALRERADRADARLREAEAKLDSLEVSYASQTETCRVLEEEFANIARERDELHRQLEGGDRGGDYQADGAEWERWQTELRALRSAKAAHEAEAKALQQAAAGAQNRYEKARQEQRQILGLVDRLQHQLHRLTGIERTAVRRARKLARVRRECLRSKRRARAEPPESLPLDREPSSSRRRRLRGARHGVRDVPMATQPNSEEKAPVRSINRHW